MKAVVFGGEKNYEVKDVQTPKIKSNQVLIKVKSCGVCRTDMHIYNGQFISKFPLIPGHEFAGEVAEIGEDVTAFKIGDRVCADNTEVCGHCYFCKRGEDLFCENFVSLGVNTAGGFAEYVAVRHDKVFALPENVTYEQATFVEPTACAVHGMDVIDVQCGDEVLIFGAGPTGIILTQLLKYGGAANVTVVASPGSKFDIVKDSGYARAVQMDRNDYSVHEAELNKLAPKGFDIVIDATGSPKVLEHAMKFVKTKGKVVVYGVCDEKDRISVSPYEIFSREIKLIGSFAQIYCFDRAIKFIEEGIVKVDNLVTKIFNLDEFGDVLDTMYNAKESIKLVVMP